MRRLAVVLVLAAFFAGGARADTASDALVHADVAHDLGYTGQGVTVALLDTGIDGDSSAVVAEHCIGACAGGAAEADGPGSAQDDQGHGTEIAHILQDVAPGVKLVVVKVADRNGRSSSTQIQAGLDWVRTHHPEVRIVNVSLAGDIPLSGDCTTLTPALASYAASVTALRTQGTLVFAASGNDGRPNGIPAPACFPPTVAVGAVYARSAGAFTATNICRDAQSAPDEVACWSNSSSQLDLLAPGAPIDTTGLGGAPGTFSGTSAAAAVAAGAAALLLQASPALTADELEAVLEQTGVPITDPRQHTTTPRVDVAFALSRLLGHPIPVPPTPSPHVAVSSTRISFGTVHGRAVRRVTLTNTGTAPLTVQISGVPAWLSGLPTRVSVAAGAHVSIAVRFRPAKSGVYKASVQLSTDDADHPSIAIRITGRRV